MITCTKFVFSTICLVSLVILNIASIYADNDGTYGWTRSMGGSGTDSSFTIVADSEGAAYIAGYYENTVDFDPSAGVDNHTSNGSTDLFITKILQDGTYGWTRTFGGSGFDYILTASIDSANNVYVGGAYENTVDFDPSAGIDNRTSVGGRDFFVSKINSDGTYGWVRSGGSAGSDEVNGVHVSHNNQLYIFGEFNDTVDFDSTAGVDNHTSSGLVDLFVSQYGTNGDYISTFTIGNSNGEIAREITTDSANNIYITGEFSSTVDFDPTPGVDNHTSNSGVDVFVTKIMANGSYGWTRTFGAVIQEKSYIIKTDRDDQVYVLGEFNDTVDFDSTAGVDNHTSQGQDDLYFSKYTSNGDYVRTITLGGPFDDEASDITFDTDNNAYVIGKFTDTVDFDPTAGVDNRTANGNFDGYFTKYSETGDYLWTKTFGGTGFDYPLGIGIDSLDHIFITGYYSGTVDFDPSSNTDQHTSNGGPSDIFITKYEGFGVSSPSGGSSSTPSSGSGTGSNTQDTLAPTGVNLVVFSYFGLLLMLTGGIIVVKVK